MVKGKCEEWGIFKPTKTRILVFVLVGIVFSAIGYMQPKLLRENQGTLFHFILNGVGITGNFLMAISVVIGFYSLVCIVLHYIFKKM